MNIWQNEVLSAIAKDRQLRKSMLFMLFTGTMLCVANVGQAIAALFGQPGIFGKLALAPFFQLHPGFILWFILVLTPVSLLFAIPAVCILARAE